jgi:hypothetical protein
MGAIDKLQRESHACFDLDMITKQQHNEALRKARRERAKGVRDKYLEYGVKRPMAYNPERKEFSNEDRQAIREQIRRDHRKTMRSSVAVFAGAIALIGLICFIIFRYQ